MFSLLLVTNIRFNSQIYKVPIVVISRVFIQKPRITVLLACETLDAKIKSFMQIYCDMYKTSLLTRWVKLSNLVKNILYFENTVVMAVNKFIPNLKRF